MTFMVTPTGLLVVRAKRHPAPSGGRDRTSQGHDTGKVTGNLAGLQVRTDYGDSPKIDRNAELFQSRSISIKMLIARICRVFGFIYFGGGMRMTVKYTATGWHWY